jgi:FkbM family methyltransferase
LAVVAVEAKFAPMLAEVRHLGHELLAVRRLAGWRCLWRYAWEVTKHAREITRQRSLASADVEMERRDWMLHVLGTTIRFEDASQWPARGSLFGQVRELYGREIYFGGPGFVIGPGDVVVDLGANAGMFAVLAAKLGAFVVAVEALPPLRLMRNLEINGCAERVSVVHGVLGVQTGLLHERPEEGLVGPGVENSQALGPPVTMEELLDTHRIASIDFLKIDIEGTEFELLRREQPWLPQVRRIAAEVHGEFGRMEDLRDELQAAGFATACALISEESAETPSSYLYAWHI